MELTGFLLLGLFSSVSWIILLTRYHSSFKDKTKQDNFITFLHNTVMADLASHVAEANRGGPGTIKTNEICEPQFKRNVLQKRQNNPHWNLHHFNNLFSVICSSCTQTVLNFFYYQGLLLSYNWLELKANSNEHCYNYYNYYYKLDCTLSLTISFKHNYQLWL